MHPPWSRSARHVGALLAICLAAPVARSQVPSDSAVRVMLQQRVQSGAVKGIVTGTIDPNGTRRVIAAGTTGKPDLPLDANTVFEIGSISKTFTNTILADMVLKGEVSLDDPVQKFLPASVKVPTRSGKQITLLDLATASSGLPRMPANFHPADDKNPYADYSVQQMYDFITSYTLPRDPGAKYEYSNLGMGLLGHALALRAGKSYEALLIERVLAPLGMTSTRITLTPAMRGAMAQGYDEAGRAQGPWDLPTLAGAGAIRSTIGDMLKYMAAQRDTTTGPLARAIALTHHVMRAGGNATTSMGLGWHLLSVQGRTIVFHNGQTGGYHGFMAIDPQTGANAVMLTNTGTSIDDIGFHLIDSTAPLKAPAKARVEVKVAPAILAAYVGVYRFAPTFAIAVTLENGALVAQATGQPKFSLFAESETDFFLKEVDAQVTFERSGTGPASAIVLHQSGANQRAPRAP
ncbi:MAG: serine hydrolase [Gemmatimonadaceae bacterium]